MRAAATGCGAISCRTMPLRSAFELEVVAVSCSGPAPPPLERRDVGVSVMFTICSATLALNVIDDGFTVMAKFGLLSRTPNADPTPPTSVRFMAIGTPSTGFARRSSSTPTTRIIETVTSATFRLSNPNPSSVPETFAKTEAKPRELGEETTLSDCAVNQLLRS